MCNATPPKVVSEHSNSKITRQSIYCSNESTKVQTLGAICQCCEHAQNNMHCGVRILEMNECANSLQMAKVNECWQELDRNNILHL